MGQGMLVNLLNHSTVQNGLLKKRACFKHPLLYFPLHFYMINAIFIVHIAYLPKTK